MHPIPLLKPNLPDSATLLPFLRRIDSVHWYTNFGPLESEFLQKLVGIQSELEGAAVYGAMASNATQALELTLSALDLPAGSKVAVPALTFAATATAVIRAGHIPVVSDVDRHSWLLDPSSLPIDGLAAVDAVIPVSTFGMPQDADAWAAWSERHGIPVVIDAAAAFGAQKTAENITVVFSLHATKTLSSVEGGFIATRHEKLAQRLKAMTNFGFGLETNSVSSNAKLSEYHAAVGLAHLSIWPSQVHQRKKLFEAYKSRLSECVGLPLVFQRDTGIHAPSLMTVRLPTAELRTRIEAECAASNIQTRRWYQPLVHQLPFIQRFELAGPLTEAEALAQTVLGLPFFPDMSQEELTRVVRVFEKLSR